MNSKNKLEELGSEPLIMNKPNLEKEFNFLKSILEKL
jgi:hypothetical protein